MKQAKTRYLLLTTTTAGVMILDQASKYYIQQTMRLHESIVILKGFFNLTYIRNPGAAFGFLADRGDGFRFMFFSITSVIAVLLLGILFVKAPREEWVVPFGISLVLGGALGNLIDRLRLGEVVDFLDLYLGKFHWPAFNLADSAITIGLLLLLLNFFLEKKRGCPSI